MSNRLRIAGVALFALGLGALAYWKWARTAPEIVVHTTVDRVLSEPILSWYDSLTKSDVLRQFDDESKTGSIPNLRVFEPPWPQCDLFWSGEVTDTIGLKDKGLLAPFRPSHAAGIPGTFKAKDGTWFGFAARARVLLVNTALIPDDARPQSILDLIDPKWKGKIGIARPFSGTAATHAACLFAAWGDERAKGFFRKLKANGVKLFSDNRQVSLGVSNGEIAFGLTDTDDAMAELSAGGPVTIIYPDRAPDQLGTLFVPATVAVVRGARHRASAEDLANFLLSPDVAKSLAAGPGARIPLDPKVKAKILIETPRTVHAMPVDFEAAAHLRAAATAFLTEEFAEK